MDDLSLEWGSDLVVGPTGDLLLVSGMDVVGHRIVRRLLTNPGDYIWQINYGAGLARSVGHPLNTARIEAAIRRHLQLEDQVASSPTPTVKVGNVDRAAGVFVADVGYASAEGNQTTQVIVSSQ